MLFVLGYQLLPWLSWGTPVTGSQAELKHVQATEFSRAFLPCPFDHKLGLDYFDLTWLGPSSGEQLFHMYVKYGDPAAKLGHMWGMLMYDLTGKRDDRFTCGWNDISGTEHTLTNVTGYQEEFLKSGKAAYFPCDAPIPNNWTEGSVLWIQKNSLNENIVLMNITIWRSANYWLWVKPNDITLILPSVSIRDAGNYTCQWNNQNHYYQLKVTAKSVAWIHFGDQHWIIWSVAVGSVMVSSGFLFCLLKIQKAICARRQQMKLRNPALRYKEAKRNRTYVSNGKVVSLANENASESVDTFFYENVERGVGRRNGQQLLQKGKILPSAITFEAEENDRQTTTREVAMSAAPSTPPVDEEVYECPDSDTEFKSEGEENYENPEEEMKQEDMAMNDASFYVNSKKEIKSASHNWSSDLLYENKTQQAFTNLTQDPVAEDGDNYENLEEKETTVSPGAARLIAGLQIAIEHHVDRQDAGSLASTGSQSYEEMNGSPSSVADKTLHLHPNTSNEDDGDSYENMESPNGSNSRKEGNMDSCREK